MSIARHHAEWLSLVPVSGPFLSLPVLLEAFNTGLEPHDPDQSRLLRQEYGNWQESFEKRKADPAPQQQWIKFVLTKTLELDDCVLAEGQAIPQTLQAEVAEHHELLRPSIVVIDPNTKKPRLLVQTYPRSQELTSYVTSSRWKASPDTRMTELLHATGVRLGLVTNGEHWMLVDAPKGETTGYASWYASLWLEEPITLRAFRSLLSASRFFNVPDEQTLEALLTKSASNQQEVTNQLGYQVRRAVEVLIHEIAKIEHEPELDEQLRKLISAIPEVALYESALTVMMRLVFLFCAEERGLIPSKPFPVYEQNYSVATISKQLRELADQHDEALLERRTDAWPRLLAAFRTVYGGLQHDDVHIPAYGGNLFNPDRFPFLEGRKQGTSWRDTEANPLPVNNRTVLHLLEKLQMLEIKVPGGGPVEARRLSFRALDIEQIGHVYEGLLDHTAKRATEPFLGLAGTRDKEPEIPLAELEKLLAKGEAALAKFLKEEAGKSENAVKKALKAELDPQDATHFRTVCHGDETLWKRVQPFAGLVRLDSFGYPAVIPKGSVFVTAGTDRRSSGTHYTPKSLTEPIVQYTLEPLVYVGPAEGLPKDQWKLRSAKELLDLKICDMACGSGAFLVQACRYMAARLLEAWDTVQRTNPGTVRITPEGETSTGQLGEMLIPDDPDERQTYALRIVAQRCLYGVDKNPLAVEMAKLSLWLLTLAKDKPFEFLDHAIRCGDSLVGIHDVEQLRRFDLRAGTGVEVQAHPIDLPFLDNRIKEAIALRSQITEMQANTVEAVEAQDRMLREANEKIDRLKCAADMLIAAEFTPGSVGDKRAARDDAAIKVAVHFNDSDLLTFRRETQKALAGQVTLHWPLEFPEVMVERGGFDAFMGNPPFMGGQLITNALTPQYRTYLTHVIANDVRGSADLCTYFVLASASLVRKNGRSGLIATSTISEGETRVVGLQQLLASHTRLTRAYSDIPWPGTISLRVAVLWFHSGNWNGPVVLDDSPVESIGSELSSDSGQHFSLHRLKGNKGGAFKGSSVQGTGFILTHEEADQLIQQDARNANVLFPYLVGKDVANDPLGRASRHIVNFFDWNEQEAAKYPLCYQIVRDKVRPQREAAGTRNDIGARRAQYWWRYDAQARDLYDAISRLPNVWVAAKTSKYVAIVEHPIRMVFSSETVVFPSNSFSFFAVVCSTFHASWAEQVSSKLNTTLRYTVADAFETFPFPAPDFLVKVCRNNAGCELQKPLDVAGRKFYEQRRMVCNLNGEGITRTYNRIHNPDETSADIQKLRQLHVEMDMAVAAAYGWTDLDLGHDFHETKQGVRYTISEAARREVLARLLKLNHERYAEEVKQGLHEKKKAKGAKQQKKSESDEPGLF